MFSVTCLGLVIFLLFKKSNGDSVTQTEGPVTLRERASVMLNCTYQTTDSAPVVFWYIQDLNKAPQLLLKTATENKRTENRGFQAMLVKSSNSFHLHKSSLQPSDSALYYCAVSDTVRCAQEVKQSPAALSAREETACFSPVVTLTRHLLASVAQAGPRGKGHRSAVDSVKSGQTSGRLKASLGKSTRQSALYIAAAQPGDSAPHLCAVRQCTTGTCTLSPNLAEL
ncbi:uncharacterized protein LOC115071501 [Nannospalax galili]|uniref:uncharacterized protein LOC115071501 n=1 Tax=Nannospalax galili TaxID=1026970 RepID=UPI00111BDD43|nr:uncharacterized protein LOC115071501 [Nannospalax galili]